MSEERNRMRIDGRREFGALALLIVLLLGALAMLPMFARGASNQINGIIVDSATRAGIPGATVSLVDANGYYPTLTTTTAGDGVYAFTPNSGSYNVAVKKFGYYANGTSTPIRFDGTVSKRQDVWLDPTPTRDKLVQLTVVDDVTSGVISGAAVDAVDLPRAQIVANGTSSVTGQLNLTLWTATFELRTNATGYMTNVASIDTSSVTTLTIRMQVGGVIQGHATSTANQFLSDGLVGFLYSGTRFDAYKVVRATVTGSFYQFHAPVGDTYTMVIDAKAYSASRTSVTVTAGPPQIRDVTLAPSANETFATTFVYKNASDWSNLTIYRNLTLNADSTLQNLNPPGVRDLRLQVDYSLGNGNGAIELAENTSFHTWLVANGPFYVTTDGNFTTNGKSYISDPASYVVRVEGLSTPGTKVWINTSATYTLKQAPPSITQGAKTYYVNVTLLPDRNISGYQDFVYTIAFPRFYELNMTTLIPGNAPVVTKSFAPAVLDPGLVQSGSAPQAKLTVSQSLTGTARAKVVAPTGKFHVVNATFSNYQAFVAGNTTMTFSAEDSTDPNGHIPDANFTWKFTPSAQAIRYGIRSDFKYTQNGQFIVNLTVKEAGGNITFRDITIWVDDQLPVASIKTNRTGSLSANGMTLKVDEGIPVKFDGGLSTDLAYPGKNGTILDSGYSWDFDGNGIADATGRIVTHPFPKPGNFTVNLTATDSVGWKSINASMTVLVNDTTAPTPAFDILDPANEWGIVTSPMERKTYSFNASKTTDEYDKVNYSGGPGLNFTWTIPGPIAVGGTALPGTNHTFYGVNVTFAWQEWNQSYTVRLAVNDTGFGSGKKNTGYLNRSIQVQIDVLLHANLKVVANTMKVNPADPEEYAQVTVTVNITNEANRGAAGNVTTQLLAISSGQTTVVATQADWLDKNGNPKATRTIGSAETVTLVFHASLLGQGNKTLQVFVYDSSEPYTWIDSANRASQPVNVRQPFWQPYAIYGSVIGIIALFVFAMYARRKIKAGEWRPLRGRRERGGEEKEKPRKEIKEEKKRL